MYSNPTTSFDQLHGALPPDRVPEDAKLDQLPQIVEQALENFSEDVLVPDAIWKDCFCLTGQVFTHNRSDSIARTWNQIEASLRPTLT